MKITNPSDRIRIINSQTNLMNQIREIAAIEDEDPFYVLDIGDIVRKHKIWKAKMPRVIPHYAVKCNDSLVVLEVLNALGTNFDCASKGEIVKVMSLGVESDRIIFANPAKMKTHIQYAKSVHIKRMTFDNEMELHKVKTLHPDAEMIIRIRCDAKDAQCPLGLKFGCDPDNEAPNLLRVAKDLGINVVGVSFHVGSGCREPASFQRAIAAVRKLFDFAETIGFKFNVVDIGGGFPGEKNTSIEEVATVVNKSLEKYFPDPNIQIIAEPGRYYVSSAYTLVCSIHNMRKVNKHPVTCEVGEHRMYYINDGIYGSFNNILYDNATVVPKPLKEYNGSDYHSSSFWGPTCDSKDMVVEEILMPDLQQGDWIVFEDMGAYTLCVASEFNGFPVPKVHMIANESICTLFRDLLPLTDEHFVMGRIPYNINCGCLKNDDFDFNLAALTNPIVVNSN